MIGDVVIVLVFAVPLVALVLGIVDAIRYPNCPRGWDSLDHAVD